MHKFGLKLWSINTDYYYDEAIRLYNDNVFDYIELYVVPNTLDTIDKWKKLKIPFVIHCPHFAHGFNLAKQEKQQSNRKIFDEVQKFADKLDVPYIVIHSGVDGNIEETANQLANFNESRALIENKPFVALPNRMGGKFCRGYNINEIKLVMDVAKCGFCLDFGHAICAANSLDKDVYSYIEDFCRLNPTMFHLTDVNDITSKYDSHPHIGTGQLDIKRILKLIPKGKNITIETIKNSKENLNDFIEDTKIMQERIQMENKEKILDILSTIFGKEINEYCSTQNEDLWDSITHLEIIVSIEEEFNIHIPQDKISQMTSVDKILEIIKSL